MVNSFTDNLLVGVVVGGDVNDPASDQSCNMKVFIPGLHGKDVKTEHLAFSTMMKMPTRAGQQTFEGTLDPGSIVFVRKDTGSNQVHIMGTGNEIYDPSSRIPGNIDLLSLPQIRKAIEQTINIRIPPTIQESSEQGVKIRKAQEKGQLHKHGLLKNIPANAAIYPLAGSIVPQVLNVATATQSFANILTPAIASLLPGLNISVNSILQSLITGNLSGALAGVVQQVVNNTDLPGEIVGAVGAAATTMISARQMREYSKRLNSNLSPSMLNTLGSMSLLMSSIETGTGGGFSSGGRVDPTTYVENTLDLIEQCDGIGDMVACMQQLQYDESLFGQDKLPEITMMVDTPFGIKMPLKVSATGQISQNIPQPLQQLINSFASSMASASGFPGINPGENLFGGSAKTMFEMFQRLSPQAQNIAITMSKTLNQSSIAQVFDQTAKTAVQGGNPFSKIFGG